MSMTNSCKKSSATSASSSYGILPLNALDAIGSSARDAMTSSKYKTTSVQTAEAKKLITSNRSAGRLKT